MSYVFKFLKINFNSHCSYYFLKLIKNSEIFKFPFMLLKLKSVIICDLNLNTLWLLPPLSQIKS